MATRRGRCMQCGRPVLVPIEAYNMPIMCSGCQQPVRPSYNNTPPYVNYPPAGPGYGYARPDQYYHYYNQPRLVRPPPPPPPSAYGSKRAVLFGISYDDVEERNPLRIPTKHNMRMAMRWLVEGCKPGDSLVFYFSGHGSREVDRNMDEIDGYDEAICSVDYEHEGKIIDDEINATIVWPLPCGAKLHALVDTCFSGTVLDLPFMCRINRKGYYGWEDHRNRRGAYKGTRGGLAVCISACDDDGSAADTAAFSGMESSGALTYSFIQAMQDEPKLTYGRLLNAMRTTIREAKEKGNSSHSEDDEEYGGMDTRLNYAHEPQLSSSDKFDVYSMSIVM